MKKLLLALSAFAVAAACSAGAQTGAPAPAPNVQFAQTLANNAPAVDCDILTTATAHGVMFSAVARADAPSSGSYEFVLTKRDRNGSSDINQGGDYQLSSDASQSLGEAELNLERRSTYHARLVLWDVDGEVCRVERES